MLEVRDEGRHLESIPLAADQALFVEDLVAQAQLHQRLGRLSIVVMRPTEGDGPPIRLDCRTDDDGKAQSVGQNYALMPGDHVIVYTDQRNSFERFIDSQF